MARADASTTGLTTATTIRSVALTISNKNSSFYLSFENSLCDHYVTEKLWSWMKKDIVPVVMGQGNYTAIAPPHSFINVMSYPEPEDLAAYLTWLIDNSTEYLSYFWWKDFYAVDQNKEIHFCRLCQMLNDMEKPPRVIGNLSQWWLSEGNCKPKDHIPGLSMSLWRKASGEGGRCYNNVIIDVMLNKTLQKLMLNFV